MKNSVPQKCMAYKKLCYLNSSHNLLREPVRPAPTARADLVSLCASYPPTHVPAPPGTQSLPKSSPPTRWGAWGGKHLPIWSIKVNKKVGKDDPEPMAVPSKVGGEQPTSPLGTDHQGPEHQPRHLPGLLEVEVQLTKLYHPNQIVPSKKTAETMSQCKNHIVFIPS